MLYSVRLLRRRGIRDFNLSVLWGNALFETLSVEIYVGTTFLDFSSYVGGCIWLD